MDKKQQQVADQCRAVAHMAKAIAEVYSDLAKLHAEDQSGLANGLAQIHGERSHRLMEQLGDAINGMDAVTDDDDWIGPVFDGARAMFPIDKIPA